MLGFSGLGNLPAKVRRGPRVQSALLCGSRVYETCRNLTDTVDDINPALPIIRSIP